MRCVREQGNKRAARPYRLRRYLPIPGPNTIADEENFHAMPLDRPKVMPRSLKSHWH